ncbi:MAG: DUF6733 family protein [Myxococcota bacterium]
MKRILILCCVSLTSTTAFATEEGSGEQLFLRVIQDANFGFYLGGTGVVPLNENTALRIYGNLYTNPVFATARGTGAWVEAGAGIEWLATESLLLGAQLGVSNGTVLAGSDEPIVAEGLVPGVDLTWTVDPLELALFASYYAGVRRQSDDGIDYLIAGGTLTATLRQWVSAGVLYELIEIWVPRQDERFTEYQWLGPVGSFRFGDRASLLLSAGWDFADRGASEFYRAQLGFTF